MLAYDSLHGLVNLDPRGGYFAQSDVEQSVREAVRKTDTQKNVARLATKNMKSLETTVTLIAYHLRVCLAHLRVLFDNFIAMVAKHGRSGAYSHTACPDGLLPIISIMEESAPEAAKAIGVRGSRAAKKPCPFPAFRLPEEPDCDPGSCSEVSISSDASEVVDYHHDDGYFHQLLADGRRRKCDHFRPGSNGFAIALWDGLDISFETMLPNANILADGRLSEIRLRGSDAPNIFLEPPVQRGKPTYSTRQARPYGPRSSPRR